MVDGKYMRLCSVTECGGTHKAQGFCLRHYRQWQRGGVKQDVTSCVHCGKAFTPSMVCAMYCSKACKRAAWRQAHPERDGELRSREKGNQVSRIYCGHCETCGAAMVLRRKRRWCSKACENRSRFVSVAPESKPCRRCGRTFKVPPFKTCPPPFCSDRCKSATAAEGRRIHKNRRKAAERGVHAEAVDPFEVFERDGWKCRLCGVRTPMALRGSYEPNAPELDHIMPLALGGAHTYRNTQCACRKCNGAKGARPPRRFRLAG